MIYHNFFGQLIYHIQKFIIINKSIEDILELASSLGVLTSLVAQPMHFLPAYAFIAQEFTTQAALYTNQQYIAGFIMTGVFAHGAYDKNTHYFHSIRALNSHILLNKA